MTQMQLAPATEQPIQHNGLDMPRLFALAVEHNNGVETLERLIALQERVDATKAQEAFGSALAAFQAEMPPVKKNRVGGHNATFAGFDDIMREAGPLLSKHKITIGFDTKQADKALTVVCRIRVGGYFEDRSFTIPVPSDMRVNDSQKFGAALSYAKRYALCAALNIITSDKDNDGAGLGFIDKSKVDDLKAKLKETNSDVVGFLAFVGADTLEEMTQTQYIKGLAALASKKVRK